MRVIIPFQESLPLGRAHDVHIVRTSLELASTGHEVDLIVGTGTPPTAVLLDHYGLEPVAGLRVHRVPLLRKIGGVSWGAPFHAAARWTIRRLAAAGPTVIFASTLKVAQALLRRPAPAPLVYELHELASLGTCSSTRLLRLERDVLRGADGVVMTTRALETEALRAYPFLRSTAVVGLAVHRSPRLDPTPYPTPGVAGAKAFYVGQLYRLQGLSVAVQALALCHGATLNVVGRGDQEAQLRTLASRFAVEGRVHLHGFRPPGALTPLLAQAHWFLLPSLAEGRMPYVSHMKCYDYLAYQRPIIASALPSVQELLTDGDSALLVPPADPLGLADAMLRLLADPGLARRLADRAWETGFLHSPARRAANLTAFLERVVTGRAGS